MSDRVTIKIPKELYQTLSRMVAGTGFSSVTDFIVFTMRNLASDGDISGVDKLNSAEVKAIRERLRKLGYIKE